MSDNVLHDSPLEFYQELFVNEGYCDAQTVLPRGESYHCHCTCGHWDIIAPDRETGLALAREHTQEITRRELEKLNS